MQLVEIERLNTSEVSIDWFIGKRCNFDCSYCSPDIHDNNSPHQDLSDLKTTALRFIERFGAENLQIGITGGEPTVNKGLIEFCKFLHEQHVKIVSVTTNGSRTAEYYIELSNYVGTLTFSQHFEFINNDEFLEKVKTVNDQKRCKTLFVQVMANANHFDQVQSAVSFYKQYDINFTVRKIRDKTNTFTAARYTTEQLDWLLEQQSKNIKPNCKVTYIDQTVKEVYVNEISTNNLNKFKGWECWAGLKHFHIWHDGTVYRGNCRQGGSLGNIKDGFELPTTTVICGIETCFCAPEITVKKKQ
jgi:MoaA/NifB/PqqE/SkfB family radical SAM enzyme